MGAEGFRIELMHGKEWDNVAEAKTLESAMLRARSLFRHETVTQVRVVETLPSGRHKVYDVQRSTPRPADAPSEGAQAMRAASNLLGGGTEAAGAAPVFSNAFDAMVDRIKSVFQRILLVAAIGAAFGTVGVLALQIVALVMSIHLF